MFQIEISFSFSLFTIVVGGPYSIERDLNGPLQKSLHGFSALKLCEKAARCQSWDICKTRGKIQPPAVGTIFMIFSETCSMIFVDIDDAIFGYLLDY